MFVDIVYVTNCNLTCHTPFKLYRAIKECFVDGKLISIFNTNSLRIINILLEITIYDKVCPGNFVADLNCQLSGLFSFISAYHTYINDSEPFVTKDNIFYLSCLLYSVNTHIRDNVVFIFPKTDEKDYDTNDTVDKLLNLFSSFKSEIETIHISLYKDNSVKVKHDENISFSTTNDTTIDKEYE